MSASPDTKLVGSGDAAPEEVRYITSGSVVSFFLLLLSGVVRGVSSSSSGLAPNTDLANATLVVATLDLDVAVVAPPFGPGVLHKPVVTVSVISSISNNKDGMVFISAPVYLLQIDLMFQTDKWRNGLLLTSIRSRLPQHNSGRMNLRHRGRLQLHHTQKPTENR